MSDPGRKDKGLKMIKGEKPSGYFSTFDGEGRRIEGETRQCVHCQFVWEYKPGSGIKRGWCTRCNGLICARPECLEAQKKKVGNSSDCLPFEEEQKRLQEKIYKELPHGVYGEDFVLTESGIIIRR